MNLKNAVLDLAKNMSDETTIDGKITNLGTVTVAGSNAHINQLENGELNISANTSASKLSVKIILLMPTKFTSPLVMNSLLIMTNSAQGTMLLMVN